MTNHTLRSPRLGLALTLALLTLTLAACSGSLPPTSWAGLVVDAGVAYMTATDRIVAVDTSEGSPLWSFGPTVEQSGLFGSSRQMLPVHAQPSVSGQLAFIGSDGQPRDIGRVFALSLDQAQVQWQFPPEGDPPLPNIFAGLVSHDGVLYVAATGQVYALDAGTGQPLWNAPVGGRVWATPLLAGERLYVSTLEHSLVALDVTQKGQVAWTFEDAQGAMAGSALLDGDTLYVGSFDSHVYAIDADTGEQRWAYDAHYWVWDGLAVYSDTLYVCDLGGYVQALYTGDGRPRWSQPVKLEGAVRANPLYVPPDVDGGGVLIVLTDVGNIYALDPGNGSIRWVANAPSARLLTRPLLDGGTLLIASLSGPVQLYGVDMAAVPAAYERQDVTYGRAPLPLYKQDQPNADVVRWHYTTAPAK